MRRRGAGTLTRLGWTGALVTVAACGEVTSSPGVDDGDASAGDSAAEETGAETSGDGDGDGDGDGTGGGEVTPRPNIPQPPEAEDLNPDPSIVEVTLVADETTISVDGETYEAYAYNGSVPDPPSARGSETSCG